MNLILKHVGVTRVLSARAPVLLALVLVVLAVPSSAFAGSIFGVLKRGSAPVAGAEITLSCSSNRQSKGQSDSRGNYSLAVAGSGSCTVTVKGMSAPVVVGSQPRRYDFEIPSSGSHLRQI